jgi:hypothetical protein
MAVIYIFTKVLYKRKKEKIIRMITSFKGQEVNLAIGLSPKIKCYKRTIVCIRECGKVYKIISVSAGSDGSLNVFFPYCKNREAYVWQFVHSYQAGSFNVDLDKVKKEYLVDTGSKLSIHNSGFVQLSGHQILSGFDRCSGKPNGIGLFSNPLEYPVQSGPTFGFQCWGLDKGFSELTKRKNDTQYIILDKKDGFHEIFDKSKGSLYNSYSLGFWIYPYEANYHVYEFEGEPFIDHIIGNYVHSPGARFTHSVLDIKNFNGVLAVALKTNWIQFAEESDYGYILGSPGGIGNKYEKLRNEKDSFQIICPRKSNWPTNLNAPNIKY